MDAGTCLDTIFFMPFEPAGGWDPGLLSSEPAHRGSSSFIMDGRTEYSPGVCMKVAGLEQAGGVVAREAGNPPRIFRASMYVNLPGPAEKSNTLLVISAEDSTGPYSYTSVNLNSLKLRQGTWNRVMLTAPVPDFHSPGDLLKVYVWNPGKQLFYIDDFKVELAVTKK